MGSGTDAFAGSGSGSGSGSGCSCSSGCSSGSGSGSDLDFGGKDGAVSATEGLLAAAAARPAGVDLSETVLCSARRPRLAPTLGGGDTVDSMARPDSCGGALGGAAIPRGGRGGSAQAHKVQLPLLDLCVGMRANAAEKANCRSRHWRPAAARWWPCASSCGRTPLSPRTIEPTSGRGHASANIRRNHLTDRIQSQLQSPVTTAAAAAQARAAAAADTRSAADSAALSRGGRKAQWAVGPR